MVVGLLGLRHLQALDLSGCPLVEQDCAELAKLVGGDMALDGGPAASLRDRAGGVAGDFADMHPKAATADPIRLRRLALRYCSMEVQQK